MTDEEKRSQAEAEETKDAQADAADSSDDETKAASSADAESGSDSEEAGEAQSAGDGPGAAEAAAMADQGGGHDHEHGHGDHGSGHGHGDHGEHLGHTAPMSLLIGVLLALSMLTVLTVAVTAVDLGGQGNFIVAMVIATVKAILVMGYFMHMFWDSKFNVVAFTSSFLFVLLFLAMTVLDRGEYQTDMDVFESEKKSQSM